MITCAEPDVPPGSYVVGYDFNVNSVIEYHCEAGHVLRGQATLTCLRTGEWSGVIPVCECEYKKRVNHSLLCHLSICFK